MKRGSPCDSRTPVPINKKFKTDDDEELKDQVEEQMSPDYAMYSGAENTKWSIDDFDIGCSLGVGFFGAVYLARERRSRFLVALKKFDRVTIAHRRQEHMVIREIETQAHVRHPNILRLYSYFWDNRSIYLVLELAGNGELFANLRRTGKYEEERAAGYARQIISAIEALHEKCIMHRDLKPENVFIAFEHTLKLGDFGWSAHSLRDKQRTYCGTLEYLAPEVAGRMEYGRKIDIWTIGVLVFEMLVGKSPFAPPEIDKANDREALIKENIRSLNYECPESMSPLAKDFLTKCLQINPDDRWTATQLLCHPWIKTHFHVNNPYIGKVGHAQLSQLSNPLLPTPKPLYGRGGNK